ncbi:Gycosyltransferase family 2 protein [Candidatus Trichorickettsia mobilis]|uniref:Gycosyltransferase family 2 protein n=1 Tax=Candidatus Trichorickettsia mobilis TaxID=1346319 RepID=A0ABZ0USJ7_9RICK|nr:glycosyltransferase [Candidatus Trichorickettsia mobilis]WPY00586.1 Gycosyltransferase family 2 protein [Candidatus Trichorickettsia mobilis]
MLKCSYIILIFNNENNIQKLVKSLENIVGSFRREFIFVDDGSTDNSLKILKQSIATLPKTTIILQQNIGPALSLNKAINLVDGDYVHFVQGSEILQPESTIKLINSCETMAASVAIGRSCTSFSEIKSSNRLSNIQVIPCPIKEILEYNPQTSRNVGLSASLVRLKLLEQVNGADDLVYNCNMSLSLRCAQYSKFAFINEGISITENITKSEAQSLFEAYNNLRAILNFVQTNPEFCQSYKSSLLLALSYELKSIQAKCNYYWKYLLSKCSNNISLEQIINYYEQELAKLL